MSSSTYLGFTPRDGSSNARAQCQGTIQRQFSGGYVLEYITEGFGVPNEGFESDETYAMERAKHSLQAGRLIAVHKIRHSARTLSEIVGLEEFNRIQDMWAQGTKRFRWSVAFPIIESYDVNGWPKAREIFGQDSYRKIYAHASATLRPLNNDERTVLDTLNLTRRVALNAWIGIDDEFSIAEMSEIPTRISKLIDQDLSGSALEGESVERMAKLRKRAAWIANKFWQQRSKEQKLQCDNCDFDPSSYLDSRQYSLRSVMDVHHLCPLEEGKRYTTTCDFALLCPTCHRIEHMLLQTGTSLFTTRS